MATIKQSDLVSTLMARRGCFFATIVAETDPRMVKTGNPYRGAMKWAKVNGLGNWVYENSVNNQRMREHQPLDSAGEVEAFVSHPRKWGTRIRRADGTVTPLVFHKGLHYFEMKVQRCLGYEYRLAGSTLDTKAVEAFLREQKESSRQGLDEPVILKDYTITNIRAITMDDTAYDVIAG